MTDMTTVPQTAGVQTPAGRAPRVVSIPPVGDGSEPFTIVGHRGAMDRLLENTIASFQETERVGCPELELDIRPTADARIVVVHDRDLDRIAADENGRDLGEVALMNLEEIQRVPLRDGHRVHTLVEVYEATTARLQVEIKDPAVVPLVVGFAARYPDAVQRVRLTGFDADALAHAHELVPERPRGIIVQRMPVEDQHPEGLDRLLERTGSIVFHCGWEGLTPEVIAAQHAEGRRVHVWPVRTAEDMADALALGADGTTVDDPEAAFGWYEEALAAKS